MGKTFLEHSGGFCSDFLQLGVRRAEDLDGTVLVYGPPSSVIREIKVTVVPELDVGCGQALYDGFDFGNFKARS